MKEYTIESFDYQDIKHELVLSDDGNRCTIRIPSEWNDQEEDLLVCRLPPTWKPSPMAILRIADALVGTLVPRDLDKIPVGEVFHMVTRLSSDTIRQLAQTKAELTKVRSELAELRQTLQSVVGSK